MAPAPAQQFPQPQPKHQRGPFHYVSLVLLAVIVFLGLFVLITWLIINPKSLQYSVVDATVHDFNLTKDNHLHASFQFTFRVHNPNARVSLRYHTFEVSAAYRDQNVAFGTVDPFHQPRRNVTRIKAKAVAQEAAISGSNAKDLRLHRSYGKIEIDVHVRAKIRFRLGLWKSSYRTMKVDCSSVVIEMSSSKKNEETPCEVTL